MHYSNFGSLINTIVKPGTNIRPQDEEANIFVTKENGKNNEIKVKLSALKPRRHVGGVEV